MGISLQRLGFCFFFMFTLVSALESDILVDRLASLFSTEIGIGLFGEDPKRGFFLAGIDGTGVLSVGEAISSRSMGRLNSPSAGLWSWALFLVDLDGELIRAEFSA